LRKRKADIPLLVSHFIQKYCKEMGRKMKRVAPEVIGLFESYTWPGNVRELGNVIERIIAIEERETIVKESLPKELLTPSRELETGFLIQPGFILNEVLDEVSCNYVKQALQAAEGDLKESASLLGVNYRSLRYLIEKFGLRIYKEANEKQSRSNSKSAL